MRRSKLFWRSILYFLYFVTTYLWFVHLNDEDRSILVVFRSLSYRRLAGFVFFLWYFKKSRWRTYYSYFTFLLWTQKESFHRLCRARPYKQISCSLSTPAVKHDHSFHNTKFWTLKSFGKFTKVALETTNLFPLELFHELLPNSDSRNWPPEQVIK